MFYHKSNLTLSSYKGCKTSPHLVSTYSEVTSSEEGTHQLAT